MGFCSTVKNFASDLIVIVASTALALVVITFSKGIYNQHQVKNDGEKFAFHNVPILAKAKEKIESAGGSCYDFVCDDLSPVIKGIGGNICKLGKSIKSRLAN